MLYQLSYARNYVNYVEPKVGMGAQKRKDFLQKNARGLGCAVARGASRLAE